MNDTQAVYLVIPGFFKDHRIDNGLPPFQCVTVANTEVYHCDDAFGDKLLLSFVVDLMVSYLFEALS